MSKRLVDSTPGGLISSSEPPYYAVIFTSQRTPGDHGYDEMAARMAELDKLMHEYLHDDPQTGQAKEFFGSKTRLTRSLPYESARIIIKNASFGAVGMCYCRHND